jgi:FkbM family methyltransferase
LRTPRERLVAEWLAANGDITYRLDFPLTPESIVVDVGGYQGQFASDVYAAYRCRIHVYEPVEEYARFTRARFAANPDVVVHDYGLAATARMERLNVTGDSSSVLSQDAGAAEQIQLASAVDELAAIGRVALLKLNIEGLEYELLDALIASGAIAYVDNLLIQFHDFVPDAVKRRESIQRGLATTHTLHWDFPFVWEAWQRTAP